MKLEPINDIKQQIGKMINYKRRKVDFSCYGQLFKEHRSTHPKNCLSSLITSCPLRVMLHFFKGRYFSYSVLCLCTGSRNHCFRFWLSLSRTCVAQCVLMNQQNQCKLNNCEENIHQTYQEVNPKWRQLIPRRTSGLKMKCVLLGFSKKKSSCKT